LFSLTTNQTKLIDTTKANKNRARLLALLCKICYIFLIRYDSQPK